MKKLIALIRKINLWPLLAPLIVAGLMLVFAFYQKKTKHEEWLNNGLTLRSEIGKVILEGKGKGCDLIQPYCYVIDESNNEPIVYFDSANNIQSSVLSKQFCNDCNERENKLTAKVANWANEHGPRPKNLWLRKYPEIIIKYINARVDDPDSIQDLECSSAEPAKNGWESQCTFRMKNKFGGVERFSSAFLISRGYATCSEKCDIYELK